MRREQIPANIREGPVSRFKLLNFRANRCAMECIIKHQSWLCLW